ncbi:GAF and ANTAR domain-containing protein [Streptomyces sp. NPDC014776]|uniref:GAF and ANTAR domain-containing protein n=1 Tax=unclassified Streptomyces TaxID=2593676 RepID=UPI00370245D0
MDWGRFAQQMASMARDLLAQDSLAATLERITASATELVDGCDAAGILGEGPCFDAAHSSHGERVFRISDLTSEQQRWPAYAPQAHKLGLGSMMGFLLFTEDEDLGALNLYSRRPGAFTTTSETAGVLLASHAAVAFSAARTHAQMEQAVATRHIIGEAMGILMDARHLTEDQAFAVLRRYSQEHNIKLREVARRVCESGTV